MASSTVVDLSFAPGVAQTLAELPYSDEMLNGQAPEEMHELDVSYAQLALLTTAPESSINEILHFVTVLRASNNEISTLRGLDALVSLEVLDLSHNRLQVVDAHSATLLKTLRRLRTIDFSHNNMSLLDLDGSVGAPSPRSAGGNTAGAGGVGGGSLTSSSAAGLTAGRAAPPSSEKNTGLTSLAAINLSHNAFIEFPDLRSAPFLQVLNMSHNRLELITDMDTRLPLLSLHSLLLHANRVPSVSNLVPLCALATSLKHLQIFDNPFTFTGEEAAEGTDASLWWRPFLLWLCPLLATVDQTELTPSERRAATEALFREHGTLSRTAMAYMNPQHKDDLEAYLKRLSASAHPPADALEVIGELRDEDDEDVSMPLKAGYEAGPGAVRNDDEEGDDEAYANDVVVPMSHVNTVRHQSISKSVSGGGGGAGRRAVGSPLGYYIDVQETPSSPANGVNNSSARTSNRVVIVDPSEQNPASSVDGGILVTNHNRQRTRTVPITTVVRALQQKTRSLEEVVAVLWRGDLARRTAAAIVIQRYMRGALARMHLSEDDGESCRFIRYQLQQAAAAARSQKAQPGLTTATGAAASAAALSRGPSTRNAAVHGTRQASLEAIEASGSSMEEVLVSMRSLQEVMSSMWVDLEEYRAMADREQRNAATLIQRWYRGYCARRDYGRVRHRVAPAQTPPSSACKCAGKTAALQKEVLELRHEVRELREMLMQTARQQRLAAYEDPEAAMDAIVQKHEARVQTNRGVERSQQQRQRQSDSRSPSATPSITGGGGGGGNDASQERGFVHSSPRADAETLEEAKEQQNAPVGKSSGVLKSPPHSHVYLHRMPEEVSARASPTSIRSPNNYNSSSSGRQARPLAKITKRRPTDATSHSGSPYDSFSTSAEGSAL